MFQGEDEMPPMFAFETSSNPGLDSLASLGAVGGLTTTSENTNGGVGGASNNNKKVNEEGGNFTEFFFDQNPFFAILKMAKNQFLN